MENGLPTATVEDLKRAGAVLLLEAPISNALIGDAIETMRVPMSVLREWLREEQR